jgi:hypothetical protein
MTGDLASTPGQMVDQLETALHVKFPPGYTPGLRFMSHLWEPLRAHYRYLTVMFSCLMSVVLSTAHYRCGCHLWCKCCV